MERSLNAPTDNQKFIIHFFSRGYTEIKKTGNSFFLHNPKTKGMAETTGKGKNFRDFIKNIYNSDYSLEEVIGEVTKTEPKPKEEVITMPKELANKKLKIEEQAIIFWNKFTNTDVLFDFIELLKDKYIHDFWNYKTKLFWSYNELLVEDRKKVVKAYSLLKRGKRWNIFTQEERQNMIPQLQKSIPYYVRMNADQEQAKKEIEQIEKSFEEFSVPTQIFLANILPYKTLNAPKKPSFIIPMNAQVPKNQLFKIPKKTQDFLGKIEIKPQHSVVATLDAPQGAGKTRFFYFLMNEMASTNNKCLFISLEEHPLSELAQSKKRQYIKPKNQALIDTLSELPTYKELCKIIEKYDCIFIDSWGKMQSGQKLDFDTDLRKKFNGKLFFVIFQRTVNQTMRGGAAAQFDGDIIMKIDKNKDGDFKQNYVYHDKNRYQAKDLNTLKFNIYKQKII